MSKIYDKLFLAVGVLALLGGIAVFFMKSGAGPDSASIDASPGNSEYAAIPMSGASGEDASWPEAPAQSSGWVYDVFTPPKIYIDPDGNFTATGYKPPPPPPPFGVYLVEIEQKPYRIQLEGYIEEDLADASKSLLLLYDEENGRSLRARIGDEKTDFEITVVDFTIERLRDEDQNITKVAKATVRDERIGEEIVLTHGERRFEDDFTVVLASREDSGFSAQLKEVGETFEGPGGTFTLQEINLEESSVKVEKLATDEEEADSRVLYAEGGTDSSEPPMDTPQSSPAPSAPEAPFESLFN